MDFQLARNLSALTGAQQEAKHCYILTPEQIVSTAKLLCQLPVQKQLSSWWLQPEQLFCRFKTCWRHNPMKGPDDFARPKSPSSLLAENAPLVHRRLMSLNLIAKNQIFRCLEDRVVLPKESPLVRDIPSRKLPYEAAYGVMMSREESEWFAVIRFRFGLRLEICGGLSCGYPFLAGLTDAG